MATDSWKEAALLLADSERAIALRNRLEQVSDSADDRHAGILRQIIAGENPLSTKQQWVFDNEILATLVERCGACPAYVPTGVDYCGTCAVEFGAGSRLDSSLTGWAPRWIA